MILKLTALMLLVTVADLVMRRLGSAALRHFLWSLAVTLALLLLPGELLVQRLSAPRFLIRSAIAAGPAALLTPVGFQWALAVYSLGAALLLLRLLLDVRAANLLVRQARPSGFPHVWISDRAVIPCAWGSIIVPTAFTEWTAERQAAVVAHEAAHLARHDRDTMLLARIACAVYWFHPLPWLAWAKLRLEADRACDDAVLRGGHARESYAEALVHIARTFRETGLAPGVVHPSRLELRVRHILARGVNRGKLGRLAIGSMLAACLAIAYPLVALTPRSASQVYKVGPGVKAPSVLKKTDPFYSPEARARKLSGTVLLSLIVGADGRGHAIHVTRKLDPGLDANAVRAVQQWRFQPGTRSGQAVDVQAAIEVNYRIK